MGLPPRPAAAVLALLAIPAAAVAAGPALAGGAEALLEVRVGGPFCLLTLYLDCGYDPQHAHVARGTTVRWVSQELAVVSHTVTADSGAFDSGALGPGQAFEVAFAAAGVHTYACEAHPWMTGMVHVS